jgi:transcriptional regulator with XRE-family HTH domain
MTQYEIAKRLGISETAVSKWYLGKSIPNGVNLVALSRLLKQDPANLIKEFTRKKANRKS